jgi:DNA-binding transcriptional LysR family regulator
LEYYHTRNISESAVILNSSSAFPELFSFSMPTHRLEHLRIKQLKFVSLLASLGSLAATAEALSLSPSAASMMLKEIETLFRAKLFRREGRGMSLTAQGRALLPRCQTVLGEVSAMGAALADVSQPLLRIGAFPHTTNTVLPQIVRTLTHTPVAWQLQIVAASAERLVEQLFAGEIDLLVGQLPRQVAATPHSRELSQRVLYRSHLCVVASQGHALFSRPKCSFEDLLNWPWVLPGIQSTTRLALIDIFLKRGLAAPLPVVESPSFFYSLSIVAGTEMLTCCAKSAVTINSDMVRMLPLDLGLDPAPISLVWRKHSAEALRAVEHLKEIIF